MPIQAQTLAEPILIPSSRKPKRRQRPQKPRFTQREQHFIKLISEGVHKTTAAIQAGYSEKNAEVIAYRVLAKSKIQRALSDIAKAAADANSITPTYVIETIKDEIEQLRANPDRSPAASQAIFRGTELLGKTIALFTDKTQEDKHITITIERVG